MTLEHSGSEARNSRELRGVVGRGLGTKSRTGSFLLDLELGLGLRDLGFRGFGFRGSGL